VELARFFDLDALADDFDLPAFRGKSGLDQVLSFERIDTTEAGVARSQKPETREGRRLWLGTQGWRQDLAAGSHDSERQEIAARDAPHGKFSAEATGVG